MPASPTAAAKAKAPDLSIGAPSAPEADAKPGESSGPLEAPKVVEVPQVDEAVVRGLVRSIGGGVHHMAGDPDVADHWRFTGRELDELVPPLTRYVNRNSRLRAAVIHGDEMAIAVVLAGWAGRNVTEGRKAADARRERETDEPASPGGADAARPAGADGGNGSARGVVRGAAGGGLR